MQTHVPNRFTASAVAGALFLVAAGSLNPAAAAEAPCPLEPYSGDNVALVVGVDDYAIYQNAAVKNLDNAVRDARTIAALLSNQGFKVRCLINPTRLAFDAEKTGLEIYLAERARLDPDAADTGRAVLYVAGHGYRDTANHFDYLLFPFDPDPAKYSGVVDLTNHAGRVAQGRFSIQALIDAFNTPRHAIILAFDACRSLLDIGTGTAGPAVSASRESLSGRQVVLYSTQPGGVALDSVPNSPDQNGLYTSMLSRFMALPLKSLTRALGLTQILVQLSSETQAPIFVPATKAALYLDDPWSDEETSDNCDLLDTAIWNSAGVHCIGLNDPKCLRKDICKVVSSALKEPLRAQTTACLARFKVKWLHQDLVAICSAPVSPAGGIFNISTIVPAMAPISQPMIEGVPLGPTIASQPMSAPISAPLAMPWRVGRSNDADTDAYNVMTVTEPNLLPTDIAKLTLVGWANKTPSLFAAINQQSPEAIAALQAAMDKRLAQLPSGPARRSFTTQQRDFLIVQSSDRKVPQQVAPPPFQVTLAGGSFTLRSLPSANADPIGTFAGNAIAADLDCYTIPCTNGWIGLRITKDATVFRGWVSAEDLKTAVAPGTSIEIEYDGKRVVPRRASIDAIRRAAQPDATKPPPRGRIQVIATRAIKEERSSSFLAGARLSFLDRLLIDLGVHPNDVVKTVVDVPNMSKLPPAIINLGKR